MSTTDFQEACYRLLRQVPRGRITTYKAIAEALGSKAYRAVGSAMNKNPYAPSTPCHRVVNSNGSIGGFASGQGNKKFLLKNEGVTIRHGIIENFEQLLFVDFLR